MRTGSCLLLERRSIYISRLIFGDKAVDTIEICHNFALDALLSAPFSIKIVKELLKKQDELLIETIGLRVPISFYEEDSVLVIRSKDLGKIIHILFSPIIECGWFLKIKKKKGKETNKDAQVLHGFV